MPQYFANLDTHTNQFVRIQFQAHSRGRFKTIGAPKITNSRGYFDVHVKFPTSGTVRLAWTYPKVDPSFLASAVGTTVNSRTVRVIVR